MTADNKQVVRWFDVRKGKLTYSMYGSRNGTDGTADCSGSTTQAIKDAGGVLYSYLYSTVTLASYLKENGYERIAINQQWDAKEGDIVMMSWGKSMADSAGAGGHVGTMKNPYDFISVDYWTGGQQGTAVSEHNIDHYLNVNRPSYFEVWRLNATTDNKQAHNSNAETPKTKRKGDKIMYLLEVVKKKGSNEVWFIDGESRSWLPNGQDIKDIQYLLDANGINSTLTKFSEDNRTLKALFKKKKEIKY